MFVVGVRWYTCVPLNFIFDCSICAWRLTAMCFTVAIVTLFSASAARAGSIVLQFLVFSAIADEARFPFLVSALKWPIYCWWIIALSVSCSAFLRICFVSLLKSSSAVILALALYCRVSGQVPLSVCLVKALIAPSAWLILSSADRLRLHLRFPVDGLWRWRFRYCSVLGSLVLLWGPLSRLWRCCLGCLGFLGTWYGGICSSSSDLPSRSSSLIIIIT